MASSIYSVISDPQDKWAWASLAGDIVDLAIPFVGGIGETVRAIKTASRVVNTVDTAADIKKGWKVGEDITNLTKAGNIPSWSALRSRYWKNKAYFSGNDYSSENIARMKKGLAPLVEHVDGKKVSDGVAPPRRKRWRKFLQIFRSNAMGTR